MNERDLEQEPDSRAGDDEQLSAYQKKPETLSEPQIEEDGVNWKERCLRLAAERENQKKRMRQMIEETRKEERHKVLSAFLEVLDNVERGLEANAGAGGPWAEGYEAIGQQLRIILEKYGVRPIECMGRYFDPHLHEAVATTDQPEHEPGQIVHVTQQGYQCEDGTVLRHAKVVVTAN